MTNLTHSKNKMTPFNRQKVHIQGGEVVTKPDSDDRMTSKTLKYSPTHGIRHRAQRFHSAALKNVDIRDVQLDVLIDDLDASSITVILPNKKRLNVPNVAGVAKGMSFTYLKPQIHAVNKDKSSVSSSKQMARYRLNRKYQDDSVSKQCALTINHDMTKHTI